MENDFVGKLRARVAAWRHGNPGRGLKIIAVAGAHGKTTTVLLLGEILQETGSSVITLTSHGSFHNGASIGGRYDTSAESVQRVLSAAKKKNVNYVIIEVSDAFIATHVLSTLVLEMTVITNDSASAQTVLNQPVEYTVVPNGFEMAGLSVAPHQAISYGEDEASEAQIANIHELRRGTEIDMIIDHQTKLTVATFLVGKANALNVAAAVSAAYVLAADTSTFEEGVARLERVAGNYDYLPKNETAYDVVVDGASTRQSLELVLGTARNVKKRRLLVAADASLSNELYDDIKRLSDRAAVIGDAPELPGVERVETMQAAYDVLKRAAKKDDLILLLGREFAAYEPENSTKAHRMVEVQGE